MINNYRRKAITETRKIVITAGQVIYGYSSVFNQLHMLCKLHFVSVSLNLAYARRVYPVGNISYKRDCE